VADSHGVDVGEGSAELVHVELNVEDWELNFRFLVMTRDGVDSLWNKLKDEVEVKLVLLLALRIKAVLERDDIGVGILR